MRAAGMLSSDATVLLVGGEAADRATLERLAEACGARNVRFRAGVAAAEIWRYQSAADVLVLPLSGKTAETARHTMPIKLFEYLAAGRAIVASDLPTTREVLTHGENGWLVAPDNAQALASAIDRLLVDDDLRGQLATNARTSAGHYTWEKRARTIVASVTDQQPHGSVAG